MAIDRAPLPPGWARTTLGEVAVLNPRSDSLPVDDSQPVTFVPMAAVDEEHGGIARPEVRPLTEVRHGYTPFTSGDVLFAKITPCMENGKVAVVPEKLVAGIGFGSTEFVVIRAEEGIEPRWLSRHLSQTSFRRRAKRAMTGAVGQQRVPKDFIATESLPIAPSREQQRIADKIDELFSDLDAGVRALERVEMNLERYRASVLKAAVAGRLTAEWRKAHPDVEPASELLKRILEERRCRWEEAQLAKYTAKGTTPPRGWQTKYKEPQPPDTSELPTLPDSWCWVTVDQAIHIIDYRGRTPPYSDSGIPHIRSNNIRNGRVVWEGLKYVSESTYDRYMTRGLPHAGDVLFTTEAPLGEVAQVPTDRLFSLAQRVMILRPCSQLLPRFLMAQLMSPPFRERLGLKKTGSTVSGISSRNFRPVSLAVPPLSEQETTSDEVDDMLSVVDSAASIVAAGPARAAGLRQTILRRAFEGGLVPQNLNDEPAERLIERIRAARAVGRLGGRRK